MANKKIQCQICGQYYVRITQSHLNLCSPGMVLEEYRQIYKATSPENLSHTALAQSAGEIATVVVDAINNDETLLNDIATRVGHHLFSEHARGKLLGTALMMLAERSSAYQGLLDRMRSIDEELFQQHRIEAGGPDGSPTDTGTLLGMAKYANSKVKDSEDTLLRLLKSAIEDRKTTGVQVNLQQNFSGVHERIPIPTSLDPKQREALRRLGTRLVREPKTVRALIADAKQNDEEEENDTEDNPECSTSLEK